MSRKPIKMGLGPLPMQLRDSVEVERIAAKAVEALPVEHSLTRYAALLRIMVQRIQDTTKHTEHRYPEMCKRLTVAGRLAAALNLITQKECEEGKP